MRWVQQGNGTAAHRPKCWQQEAQLAHARLLNEDVGQRASGPTTAREFGRKVFESARHDVRAPGRELRPAPQGYSPRTRIHSFVEQGINQSFPFTRGMYRRRLDGNGVHGALTDTVRIYSILAQNLGVGRPAKLVKMECGER